MEKKEQIQLLQTAMSEEHFDRIMALENPKLHSFVAEAIALAKPKSVYICTDAEADMDYVRQRAIENGEENSLAVEGHTAHFDGYYDQARDKPNTKYLLAPGVDLGERINSIDKAAGTAEVKELFDGIMTGRQMLVCFFCLGPTNSDFSISAVQITDSPYVAHNEYILYRPGYEQFKSIGASEDFFRFLHSEGELENNVSKNIDKRRVYIDLAEDLVYSVNTQYAGNTVGLKKLSLRLAINKASSQGWLAEHMFVMGAHGPGGRVTYFAGAFPSACGKTSTSMLDGETIIGDDIAYLRKKDGQVQCANVERGIFGIIRDVNATDDPVIYKALTTPGDVIFGNVLITDDQKPHWLGMGSELPSEGTNHSGKWQNGKKDAKGNEVTASHKNARYTISISSLSNRDELADDPGGVPLSGIVYGGRDSDTCVPVEMAFDWVEGIIAKGASIESETTAATLGAEGVRAFNLMSNLDFLSIPLGKYIQNNLDFVKDISNPPKIFSVNYFLKDKDGNYLNGMADKHIWILWAELCANGDVEVIKTPTGSIPKYKDLAKLFSEQLGAEYTKDDYIKQFTIRIPELTAKIDRIENVYKTQVDDTPLIVFEVFTAQRKRLQQAKDKYGDYISPFDLEAK